MTTERVIQLAFDGIICIFAVIGVMGTSLGTLLLLSASQPVHPGNGSPRFHIIEVEITRN